MPASREEQLAAQIVRLTTENESLRDELAAAQRRARTWRWVAQQIFQTNHPPEEDP